MTRALALDAYRYVTRNYKDNAAQSRKMERKHGASWSRAVLAASFTVMVYGGQWCAARILDEIEKQLED